MPYPTTPQQIVQNKTNTDNILNTQVSLYRDPNKINQPMYMGGMQPPDIRHAGVYEQIQQPNYRPRTPRKNRVYYEQEEPISRIEQGRSEMPVKKAKLKPVFETLFED